MKELSGESILWDFRDIWQGLLSDSINRWQVGSNTGALDEACFATDAQEDRSLA